MALPQIRFCIECRRKFNDFTGEDRNICPGCLAKPVKREKPVDEQEVENALKALEKGPVAPIAINIEPAKREVSMTTKPCADCGRPFELRHNAQKLCIDCGKAHAETKKKTNKPLKQATIKLDPKAEQPNCIVSDAQVILNLLLATGKITREQITACKTLLISLK
jgi:DNA-directed RNA polymerase subunit RPC12/RpoP